MFDVVKAPFNVNFVPILKGLLPLRIFALLAEKSGVYYSMGEFKGHKSNKSGKKIKADKNKNQ